MTHMYITSVHVFLKKQSCEWLYFSKGKLSGSEKSLICPEKLYFHLGFT